MLTITHRVDGKDNTIGLIVIGEHIDVTPLFSLSASTKKIKDYMLSNRNRKEYLDAVSSNINDPAIFIENGKHMYHRLLVKMLLYHLDIMDFECAIANAWNLPSLPMLHHYDFEFGRIKITSYGASGERDTGGHLHIIRRTRDGYYNLTALLASAKQDGCSKRTTTTLTKNKIILYKRIYAAQHSPNDVAEMFNKIDTKNTDISGDDLAANREMLIRMFVDTETHNETWVDATTFITSMMDCYSDAMFFIGELFEKYIFGRDAEKNRYPDSRVRDFQFVSGEKKDELAKQFKSDWDKNAESEKKYKNEKRIIERRAKLLGINKNDIVTK